MVLWGMMRQANRANEILVAKKDPELEEVIRNKVKAQAGKMKANCLEIDTNLPVAK